MTASPMVLTVKDLETRFPADGGSLRAVSGVSFELEKGSTLGIVGESGSGKSVLNLSLMRLVPPPGRITRGEIIFDGSDIVSLSPEEVRKLRGRRISMIFQDPAASLNPYARISSQMAEITRLHLGHSRRQAVDHAVKMLESVGIPDAARQVHSYPHEFSGGMRQRVMIAMALSCGPELLIADEPTTALDVTIQAQILDLIKSLSGRLGTSVILVTHDLGVAAGTTDKILVMYAGRVFEEAATTELFAAPANPYTKGLLRSMPDPLRDSGEPLHQIPGSPPDLASVTDGCPFAARCERAEDICRAELPPFAAVSAGHRSLCHFADEVYAESLSGTK
jgi:oligopeptide transport system ATP-binding protein